MDDISSDPVVAAVALWMIENDWPVPDDIQNATLGDLLDELVYRAFDRGYGTGWGGRG